MARAATEPETVYFKQRGFQKSEFTQSEVDVKQVDRQLISIL